MFNASICPDEGTMCDDGDPLTLLDRYDNNCNCLGISSNNPCLQDTLDLLDTLLYSGSYTANRAVISANTLDSISAIYYASSREILLTEGFDLPLGTQFLATIEPCGPAPVAGNNPSKKREEGDDTPILKVIPSPDPEYQYIQFYIEKPGKYKLDILNSLGDIEFYLFNVEFLNKGYYHKKIRTKKFKEGVYQAFFQGPGVKETDKLVVTPLPDPEKEE